MTTDKKPGPLAFGATLLVLLSWPAPGAAQDPLPPPAVNLWGPDLLEARGALHARSVWRGFHLGSPELEGEVDVGVWGEPVTASRVPTPWGVSVTVTALQVPNLAAGAATGSRLSGTLTLSRLVGEQGARFGILAGGYYGLDDEEDAGGTEVGVALREVRLPFLGEPDLILEGTALRDLGRFEGFHVDGALYVELTPPVLERRLDLQLGARGHANDYGERSFRPQALEAGLRVGWVVATPGDLRTLRLTADTGVQRIRRQRTLAAGGVGLVWR